MPFPGQPLQGMSGVRSLGDDRFVFLTDNGFGNKANSSDAMLMFNFMKMDWEAGKVGLERTVFLVRSQPRGAVPDRHRAQRKPLSHRRRFPIRNRLQPVR